MRFILYLFFTTFSVLQCACTAQAPLSGRVHYSDSSKYSRNLYLIQPKNLDDLASSYIGKVVDSTQVQEDGSFVFQNMPDAPANQLLLLAVQKHGERYPNKLENEDLEASNYMPFVWKNGVQIQLRADAEEFQKSAEFLKPSPENAAITALKTQRLLAYRTYVAAKETADSKDEAYILNKAKALEAFQKPMQLFAKETEFVLPALLAIRWISPENDFERMPEFLYGQCEKWWSSDAEQLWVQQLCAQCKPEELPVLVGAVVPNFPMPMSTGDTIGLHQLLAKGLTVVDLWASWCAPCRKENRTVLVPLWDAYHDVGFQVVGYALDASEKRWNAAIIKDGADRWPHTSHLRGDDAPLMDACRLRTIPANFVVDSNGKVLAKNLHGEELKAFVERYFK